MALSHTPFIMIVLNTDLDNTLIYSYKHDIGVDKKCVEIYHDREISYSTDITLNLLNTVKNKILVVPTTTRTTEQYVRINFGLGDFKYVLTCNGGVLLVDGVEDSEWYAESKQMIEESMPVMNKAYNLMENDPRRSFELRFIRDLFLFTKSEQPEASVEYLKEHLDLSLVDVFNNGIKVYVVPKKLNKGMGVLRLKNRLNADIILAAGDSEFDIPMIECADYAMIPAELQNSVNVSQKIKVIPDNVLFSEGYLRKVIEITEKLN